MKALLGDPTLLLPPRSSSSPSSLFLLSAENGFHHTAEGVVGEEDEAGTDAAFAHNSVVGLRTHDN